MLATEDGLLVGPGRQRWLDHLHVLPGGGPLAQRTPAAVHYGLPEPHRRRPPGSRSRSQLLVQRHERLLHHLLSLSGVVDQKPSEPHQPPVLAPEETLDPNERRRRFTVTWPTTVTVVPTSGSGADLTPEVDIDL